MVASFRCDAQPSCVLVVHRDVALEEKLASSGCVLFSSLRRNAQRRILIRPRGSAHKEQTSPFPDHLWPATCHQVPRPNQSDCFCRFASQHGDLMTHGCVHRSSWRPLPGSQWPAQMRRSADVSFVADFAFLFDIARLEHAAYYKNLDLDGLVHCKNPRSIPMLHCASHRALARGRPDDHPREMF